MVHFESLHDCQNQPLLHEEFRGVRAAMQCPKNWEILSKIHIRGGKNTKWIEPPSTVTCVYLDTNSWSQNRYSQQNTLSPLGLASNAISLYLTPLEIFLRTFHSTLQWDF